MQLRTIGTITCLAGLSACGSRASDEISTTSGILSPASLPDIQYHLTARPWTPLETPRDAYLDRIEGIVRFEATLQNGAGAIIDPVANQEWQYATPYFANSLGLLLSAG